MEEKKIQENEQKKDDSAIGFVIAIVALFGGIIMYLAWDDFGSELWMKLLSIPFIFFGIIGLGVETTNKTKDEGATEMGIGLGFTFGALILKDSLAFIPNLIILFLLLFSMLFIGASIGRLATSKKKKKISGHPFYRGVIITGQVAGAILSISELAQFLLR